MVLAVVIGYYYACLSPREKQKFWSNVLGALFCVLIIGILISIIGDKISEYPTKSLPIKIFRKKLQKQQG